VPQTARLVQGLSRKPLSIPKLVLQAIYQIARNEQSRYYRYKKRGLPTPPKPPPSQRRVLSVENTS
jgi:hypothetical protein